MRVKIMAKEGSKQTVYGKPIQKKGIPIRDAFIIVYNPA